jgi:regulator of sirC expression with transglutaminase-like and TPR domain
MSADRDETRRLFVANLRRREERIDLALAALLLAKEEYPGISVEDYLLRLDQLGAELQVEIDLDAGAAEMASVVVRFLAGENEFRGNREDYYDPRNSYLSQVMDRRLGIPITLSIVYMEVARRAGISLLPVSFPGHFLLKPAAPPPAILVDAFSGGRLLDIDDCRRLLTAQYGEALPFSEALLGAATKRQVITRLINNLKAGYLRTNDLARALRSVDQLLAVTPWDLDQIRDRGVLNYSLGRVAEAVHDLRTYVEHAPPGAALDAAQETLRRIS